MRLESCCGAAAEKLEQAESQLSHSGRTGRFAAPMDRRPHANDNQLLKICRDSSKMSVEQVKGISSQVCVHTQNVAAIVQILLVQPFWQDSVAERCMLPNTNSDAIASASLVAAGIFVFLALFVAG